MAKLQCERCKARKTDVERAHMFFCVGCAGQHQAIAFGGSAPVFRLNVGNGHCEFCGQQTPLEYFQWLLCGICSNVVGSYRKGKVSASFVLAELNRVVVPLVPGLTFREVDPVVVQPYRQRRRRVAATQLDIEALSGGHRVFWIEVKTGPSAIGAGGMPEFQLDCQDCDDISNTIATSSLPALLAHCQVGKTVQAPTMRIVGERVWWTDLWDFGAAFKTVFDRRGASRKKAASFETACFQELPALAALIQDGWLPAALDRIQAGDSPVLYVP